MHAHTHTPTCTQASSPPPTLARVLEAVGDAAEHARDAVLQTMVASTSGEQTLAELRRPEVSGTVRLSAPLVSALQSAASKLASTRVTLWELVEGGCEELTTRFAELVAGILKHSAAMMVTREDEKPLPLPNLQLIAAQTRILFQKTEAAATSYRRSVGAPPQWTSVDDTATPEAVAEARRAHVTRGQWVEVARVNGGGCRSTHVRNGFVW